MSRIEEEDNRKWYGQPGLKGTRSWSYGKDFGFESEGDGKIFKGFEKNSNMTWFMFKQSCSGCRVQNQLWGHDGERQHSEEPC